MNKREGFVQISIEEYDDLKEAAKFKEIPATISKITVAGSLVPETVIVDIDMYKLKRQICNQNNIDPNNTTVQFY
ncbi:MULTISPECIES: hypothetical protein [Carnobacterium]|uniref:Uncharacterized protein n=1 Tax=Carnobacterium antarcticum TaxID=2126436 RepID=A0ABW4NMM1_9LACT|nr:MULTISPECIES: hypothetical protein [unclassified Carnobacterium]ALV21046.1 hypothetical protein NY10_426 [Carnobacterium sp. CP1]QQP71196.1 hypothetical protein JHE06_05345 [Carnobacterium sp. CS13]